MKMTHTASRSLPLPALLLVLGALVFVADRVHAQSLLFDADAGEAASGSGNQPDITGEITVEAWVRIDAAADAVGINFIISKNINGTGFTLLASGTGTAKRFQFEANLVTGSAVVGTSRPPVGVWTHVAGVWGNGMASLYVNGVLENQVAVVDPPVTNEFPVQLGSSPFGEALNWRGEIDEARIWSRVLSATELRRSMWSSIESDPAGSNDLVASWTLAEGSGTTVIDRTGNSNDLQLANTAWSTNVPLEVPNLSTVVSGVSQLISPGAPGSLLAFEGNWQTLVGGDDDASLLSAFAMASCFGGELPCRAGHRGQPFDS